MRLEIIVARAAASAWIAVAYYRKTALRAFLPTNGRKENASLPFEKQRAVTVDDDIALARAHHEIAPGLELEEMAAAVLPPIGHPVGDRGLVCQPLLAAEIAGDGAGKRIDEEKSRCVARRADEIVVIGPRGRTAGHEPDERERHEKFASHE